MKKLILTTIALHTFSAIALGADSVDPLFNKQWALKNSGQIILKNISDLERVQVQGIPGIDINWVETKDVPSSKKELVVAVLDSGLDIQHPDLAGRIWYNKTLCEGATNAANLACNGYNYLENNTVLTDDVGHGTHVAGLIAANRNTIGVAGAGDPRIKIMPLKVLNNQVNGFTYNGKVITDVIADAMTFAVKNGAEVINLSLGWPKLLDLPKVRQAFQYAEDNNVIVIAASGNNNKDLPTFPCSYENVICVGAIDNRGELTDFTNHGSKVDVVAPGESIVSTFPSTLESRVLRIKNYETKRGSSQAAPYVTAAIANLKLLHPGLSNDQVRDLVFRSSRTLPNKNSSRFVKFGALDMKGLLELANQDEKKAFVNPQIKSLTEVKFTSSTRKFSFNLDLKNLSNVNFSGPVCLSTKSAAIQLDQSCFDVPSIGAHQVLPVPVTGVIVDQTLDSHVLVEIKIAGETYQTSLVFSRDLTNDREVVSFPVGSVSYEDMVAVLSGDRRSSKMTRVFDKHKRLNYPEYFYLERLKQTETETKISLLTNTNGKFLVKNITLPKVNKVLSIHRQDINLDGKIDYFIYTLSAKKDELQFYLLDENLNPLFKDQSTWSMTLTTFEGLPLDGGVEKFEWIKLKHPTLGSILVPSIYRTYTMPEVDNSKTISERVIGAFSHQYYLNPVVKKDKVEIELRVVDSVGMMKALRTEMKISGTFDTKSAYLLRPFPQTAEESANGIIRSLVGVNEDGVVSLYEIFLAIDGKNYSKLSGLRAEQAVDQSLIYPITDLKTGAITNEAIFTTLLNRGTAEFLVKDHQEIGSIIKLAEDWENPIIALIATFNENNSKTYLVESRSSLTLLRDNEEKFSLPIYRDSSFPGQSFSETLTPILSEGRPGVYINSTLIYGERLYSMIDTENNGFIRPLRLSVSLPTGCAALIPETLKDKTQSNYAFLCIDSSKEVSLKFLPMSHL